jgi:hypothetical protein
MPARNLKSIIMGRNRTGIDHEMKKEHPSLHVAFGLLNQWLSFPTLSRLNILYAARHVQTLREHVDWINDIPSQDKIDRLDRAVADAKARLQRREDKREKIKAAEVAAEPKVDRRRKVVEPLPPAPEVDPSSIWKKANEERKQL